MSLCHPVFFTGGDTGRLADHGFVAGAFYDSRGVAAGWGVWETSGSDKAGGRWRRGYRICEGASCWGGSDVSYCL